MTTSDTHRRIDRASIEVTASPDAAYAAVADPVALVKWLPPTGMKGEVLEYDFREGGRYRIALTYEDPAPGTKGKTSAHTDVSAGRFVAIEPGARIVQAGAFDSADEDLAGEMTLTWSFERSTHGTKVTVAAENVPRSISASDHEAGLRSSLENLARHLG